MKRIVIALILVVMGTATMAQNSKLPDNIMLKDLNGGQVNLSNLVAEDSTQVVVLNFWATWCGPCIKELAAIQDIYEEWKEKYNFKFIAVSIDNTRTSGKVKPMVSAKGWEYIVLLDENEDLKRAMNVLNPPFTFILNHKGEILYKHEGYQPGAEIELEEKLAELSTKQ